MPLDVSNPVVIPPAPQRQFDKFRAVQLSVNYQNPNVPPSATAFVVKSSVDETGKWTDPTPHDIEVAKAAGQKLAGRLSVPNLYALAAQHAALGNTDLATGLDLVTKALLFEAQRAGVL